MKFIKLPKPTSQCDEGPLLSMDKEPNLDEHFQ